MDMFSYLLTGTHVTYTTLYQSDHLWKYANRLSKDRTINVAPKSELLRENGT